MVSAVGHPRYSLLSAECRQAYVDCTGELACRTWLCQVLLCQVLHFAMWQDFLSQVLTLRAAAMQVPEASLAQSIVDDREAAAARMNAAAQEAMEELRRRVQAAAARAGAAAGPSMEPAASAEPVAEAAQPAAEAAQPAAKVQLVQPLAPAVCVKGETGTVHMVAA